MSARESQLARDIVLELARLIKIDGDWKWNPQITGFDRESRRYLSELLGSIVMCMPELIHTALEVARQKNPAQTIFASDGVLRECKALMGQYAKQYGNVPLRYASWSAWCKNMNASPPIQTNPKVRLQELMHLGIVERVLVLRKGSDGRNHRVPEFHVAQQFLTNPDLLIEITGKPQ